MSLFPWACSSTADIWDAGLTFMCDTGLMATAEKENFSPFHGTSVAESSLDRKQNSLDTAEKGKLEPSLPLGRTLTLSRSSAVALNNSFRSKKLQNDNTIRKVQCEEAPKDGAVKESLTMNTRPAKIEVCWQKDGFIEKIQSKMAQFPVVSVRNGSDVGQN